MVVADTCSECNRKYIRGYNQGVFDAMNNYSSGYTGVIIFGSSLVQNNNAIIKRQKDVKGFYHKIIPHGYNENGYRTGYYDATLNHQNRIILTASTHGSIIQSIFSASFITL